MKKFIYSILFFMAASVASAGNTPGFSVMQFNVWQEGTVVDGGFDAIADEIARFQPDFVTFSEVRNYNNTRFCDRITKALAERGCPDYHSFYSYDSGLLSRYAITDSAVVYPHNDDHGTIYRLNTSIHGCPIAVYTGHLDYLNDTYYDVRGYDGSTWKQLPEPLTDVDSILARNARSRREEAIDSFLLDAARQRERGALVVFGGDFNEPSGLDWTVATADSADHHGVVIDWPCTRKLMAGSYTDSYREIHPDPVTHPGYTYPAYLDCMPPEKVTWAPLSDERERIDYIFYHPAEGKLKAIESFIIGPRDMVVRSKRHPLTSSDPHLTPISIWPSDHKALLTRFSIIPPKNTPK